DVSPLQVQGPKSATLMGDLFGAWIDELRYYWCRETELDGIPLVVSRTGWSSERGYEIYLRDGAEGERLWELIMAAGRPHGIAPGAPSTIRRIEGGMLSYGSDVTLAENPFELGLGRLVDLDMEADYVGKAALRRIAAEGATRRLVGLEIGGPPLAAGNEEPWPLRAAGAPVGRLTSCVHSPRLEKNIGLAIVPLARAEEGCRLDVEAPGGLLEASVVRTPFYDPKKTLAAG
ncbi:MAG: aminomethyl transferase family protein, partial [Rhodospirillales bacterium]|nr:aminomethyl transferase family protein [Rhodospirillales bacterium]